MACNCNNIEFEFWRVTTPKNKEVDDANVSGTGAGKTVIELYGELYNGGVWSTDKSKACSLIGILKKLAKKSWVKNDSNKLERAKELKDDICKNIIGVEEVVVVQNGSGVETKKEPKKVLSGCIEPEASNYYCKLNACADDKLPDGIKSTKCEYTTTFDLKLNYMFCNDHTCTPSNAGKNELGYVTDKEYVVKTPNKRRVNGLINDIEGLISKALNRDNSRFLPIGGQGFYDEENEMVFVPDMAKAIAMVLYTTDEVGYDTFPFKNLTVYSPNTGTEPYGEFVFETKIDKDSLSGRIIDIRVTDSTNTLRKRLSNVKSGELEFPREYIHGMNRTFEKLFIHGWYVDNSGKLVKETIVGLGSLLNEEPEGLGKLLK